MLDLLGEKRGSQVSSVLDGPPTVRELKSHSKKILSVLAEAARVATS